MGILGKMKGLGWCDNVYAGAVGGAGIEYFRQENRAGLGVRTGVRA